MSKKIDDTILKSLNSLLNETIKEFNELKKSDDGGKLQAANEHKEISLVPDGANGSMPAESGQGEVTGAGIDPKEADGKANPSKVTTEKPKPNQSAITPDLNKEDEKKEDDEDDEKKKKKDEDDKELFEKKIKKSVDDGFGDIRKSYDERFETLGKTLNAQTELIKSLTESVQKLAGQPVSARKSISGLQPLRKSEDEFAPQPLNKTATVNKLLDMQKNGDRRINPALITKCELAGSPAELESLTKGLI